MFHVRGELIHKISFRATHRLNHVTLPGCPKPSTFPLLQHIFLLTAAFWGPGGLFPSIGTGLDPRNWRILPLNTYLHWRDHRRNSGAAERIWGV
jgi:hypothetical protein